MKLSARAVAVVKTGYRWTPEDHRLVVQPMLQRMALVRRMRALDLRSHPGWKLCNQHGQTCRDPAHEARC